MLRKALLAATLVALAAPAAVAAPGAQAAPTDPVSVTIEQLEPRVLTATGTLSLQGRISSVTTVRDLHVALWTGPTVRSRAELHRLRDTGPLPRARRVDSAREDVPGGRTAGRGAPATWRTRVTVADLRLAPEQLGSLSVVVSGRTGDGPVRELGRTTTFLPYFPDRITGAPGVNLVLPFTDDPGQTAPLPSLAAQPRLAALAAAAARSQPGAGHPQPSAVTLALDPAVTARLVDRSALRALAGTPGVTLSAMPWADADLDGLTAAGRGRAVQQRLTAAPGLVAADLGVTEVGSEPLLPPGGVASRATLDTATAAGLQSVVLDGVLAAPTTGMATPTALTTVGDASALVTDPELQRLLTVADTGAGSGRMAEQQLLAELAMITAEAPNATTDRAVVLLAPRRWQAGADWAGQLVADLGAVPWLRPAALGALAAGTPAPREGSLPEEVTTSLTPALVTADDQLRQGASTLGSLYGDPALATSLAHLVDDAESATWREDPARAAALRETVRSQVARATGGISVSTSDRVLLTGASGSVPVTVATTLERAATLVLRLRSVDGARIGTVTTTVTVPAAASGATVRSQVRLQVTSRGSGRFPVVLEVITADGQSLAVPHRLVVRSGDLGGIALVITWSALALLVALLAFRSVRGVWRWRRRRRAPAAERRQHPVGVA